jgi:hypothetical protein
MPDVSVRIGRRPTERHTELMDCGDERDDEAPDEQALDGAKAASTPPRRGSHPLKGIGRPAERTSTMTIAPSENPADTVGILSTAE